MSKRVEKAGWNNYIDAMLTNMTLVEIPYAIQNITGMVEQADQNQQVTVNK